MSEIASRETSQPTLVCSKCHYEHSRKGQRYCLSCHNQYVRAWRKTNPVSVVQEVKIAARSVARLAKSRGFLVQSPCETCGSVKSEMHHRDYSKPLEVRWLCRRCHLALHKAEAAGADLLCKCGTVRQNPKDAYCKECRRQASALARERARQELEQLRAIAQRARMEG